MWWPWLGRMSVMRVVGGRSRPSVIRVDLMVAIILVMTVVSRWCGPVVHTIMLVIIVMVNALVQFLMSVC